MIFRSLACIARPPDRIGADRAAQMADASSRAGLEFRGAIPGQRRRRRRGRRRK